MKLETIATKMCEILEILGMDCNSEHLRGTPMRVATMFVHEFFDSVNKMPPEITVFDEKTYDQMIIVEDIQYYTLCSHHLLPFFGKVAVGYIPDGKIIGLSKFARVVDYYSKKPQVQEQFTEEICKYINDTLKPLGCGVLVTGRHLCMEARGAKSKANFVTTALKGVFLDKPDVKDEFLRGVNL